jgi:hypothetical protein
MNFKIYPTFFLMALALSLFLSFQLKNAHAQVALPNQAAQPTVIGADNVQAPVGSTGSGLPTDINGNRSGPYYDNGAAAASGTTANGGTIGSTPTTAGGSTIGADSTTASGVPMGTTTIDANTAIRANTCIDIERQRLCGIEARDYCRSNLTADACQKIISEANSVNSTRR